MKHGFSGPICNLNRYENHCLKVAQAALSLSQVDAVHRHHHPQVVSVTTDSKVPVGKISERSSLNKGTGMLTMIFQQLIDKHTLVDFQGIHLVSHRDADVFKNRDQREDSEI